MTLTEWYITTWVLTCLTELLVVLLFFPFSARLFMIVVILNTATQPAVFKASMEIYETFLFRPFALWGLWLTAEISAFAAEAAGWRYFYRCSVKKCTAASFTTNACTALMSFLL